MKERRKMKKFFAGILVALMLLGTCACGGKNADNQLMWELKDGDTTVYLFGSMHMGTEDMYPLNDKITTAFDKSDYVMFELKLDEEIPIPETYNPEGVKLSNIIGQEMFDKLVAIIQEVDNVTEVSEYEKFTPYMMYVYIDALAYSLAGLKGDCGVENFLMKIAQEDGKPILGAEANEQRMRIFNQMDEDAVSNLKRLVDEDFSIIDKSSYYKDIYMAYRSGDGDTLYNLEGLGAMVLPRDEAMYNITLDRNVEMADSVEECIKDGKNVFVAVGLAHLLGDGSVVDLLRLRGYEVTLVSGME